MKKLIEQVRFVGRFDVWDHPGYSTEFLRRYMEENLEGLFTLPGMKASKPVFNVVMAAQKQIAGEYVYSTIDHLVITDQTDTPADNETDWTGTIYTTSTAEEYYRSAGGNPYQVGWNITSSSANGTWGSFVCVTSTGAVINRSLAGTSKASGEGKIVMFSGSVE